MNKKFAILIIFINFPFMVYTQQNVGWLNIESTPSGAEIYINNNYRGQTPTELELPVGNHTLEIRYRDYDSQRLTVAIRRNEVYRQSITLRTAIGFREHPPDDKVIEQARGNLTIRTEPPDATVFIDGIEVRQKTPFTIYDVGAGERRIRIRQRMGAPLDDYLDIELRATIKANETALLRVDLYEYLRTGTLNLPKGTTTLDDTEIDGLPTHLHEQAKNLRNQINQINNIEQLEMMMAQATAAREMVTDELSISMIEFLINAVKKRIDSITKIKDNID